MHGFAFERRTRLIDIENWFLFLTLLSLRKTRKHSGRSNRGSARSNGEQLKNQVVTVENLLKRLEVCNFFKVIKISENNFTLILRSELTKKFIMIFLEEYLLEMGIKAELKGNLSKINICTQPT